MTIRAAPLSFTATNQEKTTSTRDSGALSEGEPWSDISSLSDRGVALTQISENYSVANEMCASFT